MSTQYVSTTLAVQTCCNCGMLFGVQADWDAAREQDHKNFHCPAGHPQHYTGESNKDKAERLQKRFEEERSLRWAAEHKEELAKKRLKRVKERVANGVCPCCNRTFGNLHRHMKARHPEFKKQTEPKEHP